MMSVPQMLRAAAQKRGAAPALIYGERTRSWCEWLGDVERLAQGLRDLGLHDGGRVVVLALNSDRYLDAFYATAWAGGIVVPINTRINADEVAYVLDHSDAKLAFVDAALRPLLEEAAASVGRLVTAIGFEPAAGLVDVADLIARSQAAPDAGRLGADISGIFYTGGTTGRPKGVMLSHANHVVHSLAMWNGRGVAADALRYLHAAPMFHAADVEFIYGVTLAAGTHYVIERFDPAAFVEAVARWRITDAVLVPTMIGMLLDEPSLVGADMSSLARLWYGGSPMPEATIRRLRDALPDCAAIQLYGQTEAGPIITTLGPDDHDPSGPFPARLRSAGTAIAGCEVRILDSEGHECPTGSLGEIVARSGSIMSGYWRDPEQTATALRGGWLHTGDAGYLDADGYLYVTDRFKDMIITGGENVYSVEVEQAIYAFPGVAQCAVIGLPDPRWGERIHAIMVPQPGQSIALGDLEISLRMTLAGYKMPRSFELRDAPLPTSGAGKILKRVLREEALGEAPTT